MSLVCMLSAYIIRMLRTSLIDVMASEYVTMARLKGLSTSRIVLRHALPSALAPTINVVAVIVAWLIGGVVVVETIFNYPGIGAYAVQAVQNRDLPVLQALALLGALRTSPRACWPIWRRSLSTRGFAVEGRDDARATQRG